jgi:hypothetical protein
MEQNGKIIRARSIEGKKKKFTNQAVLFVLRPCMNNLSISFQDS